MDSLWGRWEAHHRDLDLDPDDISRDGILNENRWADATKHVLFVLKDTNDYKRGDLRVLLSGGPWGQAFHTVARWAAGILGDFPPFAEIDRYSVMRDALAQIAAINLKKHTGGPAVHQSIVHAFAHQDRELLREQITSIAPEIIVACGTVDVLVWLLDLQVAPGDLWARPAWAPDLNAWVIPMRHPGRADNRETYRELAGLVRQTYDQPAV